MTTKLMSVCNNCYSLYRQDTHPNSFSTALMHVDDFVGLLSTHLYLFFSLHMTAERIAKNDRCVFEIYELYFTILSCGEHCG